MKKEPEQRRRRFLSRKRDESAFSNNQAEQNSEADNSAENSEKTTATETNSNSEPQRKHHEIEPSGKTLDLTQLKLLPTNDLVNIVRSISSLG